MRACYEIYYGDYGLWAPMAGPIFSCGRQMAGPTDVSPSSVGSEWMSPPSPVGANGWPH